MRLKYLWCGDFASSNRRYFAFRGAESGFFCTGEPCLSRFCAIYYHDVAFKEIFDIIS